MFALINRGLEFVDRGSINEPDFSLEDFNAPGVTILDLSDIIPVGTKLVICRFTVLEDTGNKQIQVKTQLYNGIGYNTINTWTQGAGLPYGFQGFVKPTVDRTIYVRIAAGTWSFFELVINSYFK